jgi:glutamine amidotransferase PdxT
MKIGVLALQGAFAEHIAVLHRLEVEAVPVRLPRELQGLDGLIIPGVFIRAPVIEQANGEVEILARLDGGTSVAARQGKLLASVFHPELTDDLRFHQYFIDIMSGK